MNRVGLMGLGYAIPSRVPPGEGAPPGGEVTAIRSDLEQGMFTGGAGRRFLAEDETLEGLMSQAARRALDDAGITPGEVDRLYGYGLMSRLVSPNCLFAVHRSLGLGAATWVVPVATDFTNFLTAVALAQEAVLADKARFVLVVCGAHLSSHVEPGSGYAVAIGDAAAAAVVGRAERDTIADCVFDVDSSLYDCAVVTAGGPEGGPRFQLDPAQLPALHEHGIVRPPKLVQQLLQRNNLWRQDITLIAHQPTRVLMDMWRKSIAPAAYLDTFDTLGNATVASVPATLAMRRREIQTPYVVLMSPGPGMHVVAMLVRRGEGTGATRRLRHA